MICTATTAPPTSRFLHVKVEGSLLLRTLMHSCSAVRVGTCYTYTIIVISLRVVRLMLLEKALKKGVVLFFLNSQHNSFGLHLAICYGNCFVVSESNNSSKLFMKDIKHA